MDSPKPACLVQGLWRLGCQSSCSDVAKGPLGPRTKANASLSTSSFSTSQPGAMRDQHTPVYSLSSCLPSTALPVASNEVLCFLQFVKFPPGDWCLGHTSRRWNSSSSLFTSRRQYGNCEGAPTLQIGSCRDLNQACNFHTRKAVFGKGVSFSCSTAAVAVTGLCSERQSLRQDAVLGITRAKLVLFLQAVRTFSAYLLAEKL